MDRQRIEEYHAARSLSDKSFQSSCYAPHVTMYLDTLGNVLACCQNMKYPMGNVQTERLHEIWHGARTKKMRRALEKDRFSAGCQFCEWQISVGNYENTFARMFDRFPVTETDPEWPKMMEFSVSNTCNLECIMCIGTLSSSIRARREALPPLPKAYGDQFFEDLRPFLHHLEFAKFLGGEPFLAAESFRIWDLMAEEGVSFPCHVTTNGTQFNAKVEKVLERFPISFCVSMDGATKETVESIRVNAKFETVHENFRRFHAYTKDRGTNITLTYCLMRQNWHEFGDYLLFGDEWGCPVYVNLVREPPHCSLYTLPIDELAMIADSLEQQSERLLPQLRGNRGIWEEQLASIRRRVEHARESSRSPFATPLSLVIIGNAPPRDASKDANLRLQGKLYEIIGKEQPTITFESDEDDRLVSFDSNDGTFLGIPADECLGDLFPEVVDKLEGLIGVRRTVNVANFLEHVDRIIFFHRADGKVFSLRLVSVPKMHDEFGTVCGSVAAGFFRILSPVGMNAVAEKADREMRDWFPENAICRIKMDFAGRIVSIEAPDGFPMEAIAHLAPGMNEEEYAQVCIDHWGRQYHENADLSIGKETRDLFFVSDSSVVRTRQTVMPDFDAEGKHLGWTRFLGVYSIDADRAKRTGESARQSLADWAGNDQLLKVQQSRTGEVSRIDGSIDIFHGVDLSSLIGKHGNDVVAGITEFLGSPTAYSTSESVDRCERFVEFNSVGNTIECRIIRIPQFSPSGSYLGLTQFIAARSTQTSPKDSSPDSECTPEPESPHDSETAPMDWDTLQVAATNELSSWCDHSPVLHLRENNREGCIQADLTGEAWHGIPTEWFVGKDQHQLSEELQNRWGELRFVSGGNWRDFSDVIVEFRSPEASTLVRSLTISDPNAPAEDEVTVRYVALRKQRSAAEAVSPAVRGSAHH